MMSHERKTFIIRKVGHCFVKRLKAILLCIEKGANGQKWPGFWSSGLSGHSRSNGSLEHQLQFCQLNWLVGGMVSGFKSIFLYRPCLYPLFLKEGCSLSTGPVSVCAADGHALFPSTSGTASAWSWKTCRGPTLPTHCGCCGGAGPEKWGYSLLVNGET